MKIFYHDQFAARYASDPAADHGRLEPSLKLLSEKYAFVEPRPAMKEEVLLVHTDRHYRDIAGDELLLETALLAAGATIEASDTAMAGEYAFALCRPPGHHASPDSSWGFCYFNNLAVAVKRLLNSGEINSALIVDFDLHYGDGTANIFQAEPAVSFWHGGENSRAGYLKELEADLHAYKADLVAVSAGFDRGIDDWGSMLTAEDYREIGRILSAFAAMECQGRLFAALEGGYNANAVAKNLDAFLDGLHI